MKTFLIADLHFGHEGVCHFLNQYGKPLRPFLTAEEMDEEIIERWNKKVSPNDKVYVLGDVAMSRQHISTIGRCNGTKVLIKGNHDLFKLSDYTPYFKDIRGSHKLDSFILTHIPIHPESVARWTSGNIHGHLHSYNVMKDGVKDDRYFCVSVEQIDYAPIDFEEIRKIYANK